MSAEREPDALDKCLQEALSKIIEHCDSVRIFVTIHDGEKDSTAGRTRGRGNFYAQRGHVQEWITRITEEERIAARRDAEEDEE